MTWLQADGAGCFAASDCVFNNAANVNAYLDGLLRRGIMTVDINGWISPLSVATECTTYSCEVPGLGAKGTWYTNTMAVWDAVMAHALRTGKRCACIRRPISTPGRLALTVRPSRRP